MEKEYGQKYTIFTLIGFVFLIIGSLFLLISSKVDKNPDIQNQQCNTKPQNIRFPQVSVGYKYLIVTSLYIISTIVSFYLLLRVVEYFVTILLNWGYAPGGTFSAQLTSVTQFAVITALVGMIIYQGAKWIQKHLEKEATSQMRDNISVSISDLVATVMLFMISLFIFVVLLSEFFGLIQFLLNPDLVDLPEEYGNWIPNQDQTINLIGGLFGSTLAIIYYIFMIKIKWIMNNVYHR